MIFVAKDITTEFIQKIYLDYTEGFKAKSKALEDSRLREIIDGETISKDSSSGRLRQSKGKHEPALCQACMAGLCAYTKMSKGTLALAVTPLSLLDRAHNPEL